MTRTKNIPDKYIIPYSGRTIDGVYVPATEEESVSSILPMDPMQEQMMEDIRSYVEGTMDLEAICRYDQEEPEQDMATAEGPAENLSEKVLNEDEKAGVRILRGVNYARNLALSPYLYECSGLGTPDYMEYVQTSPKFRYNMGCIKSIKEYHEKEGSTMSGIIIYMDRGVSLFPLLKEYLVKELGFKDHEVGIISAKMKTPKGLKKKDAKEAIQNKFLGRVFNEETLRYDPIPDEDRIKILIGSSSIKEGMNLQRHSSTLFNDWLEWNPTDMIQLNGRIWRQGNLFEAIRIANALLENSMDVFIFQKLLEKTSRINAIFNRDGKTNFLSTEEFSPKELKESLIRDPRALASIIVDQENEQSKDEISEIENNIKIAESIMKMLRTIDEHSIDLTEIVEKFRPIKADQTRADTTYVSLMDKIIKEQTDGQGRDLRDPEIKREYDLSQHAEGVYAPYWYSDYKSSIRLLERQREVFLEPKSIDESVGGIEFYIKDETNRLNSLKQTMEEASSEDNIDRITADIITEREQDKYRPASVEERIQEFTKLNHLLSLRVDVPEAKKPAPSTKPVNKDKEKARARIRLKQKLLDIQKQKK